MPPELIPTHPAFFAPQHTDTFFAAGDAFFLIDPARLLEIGGAHLLHSDLLRHIAPPMQDPRIPRKASIRRNPTQDLYEQGALVPAFGLERGFYNVHIRSTQTEDAPLPLTHIVFSAGFVLGTETGTLILANADRLQPWAPGVTRASTSGGQAGHPSPLAGLERTIQISPGWYAVTVLAGLRDAPEDANQSTDNVEDDPRLSAQHYEDDYSQDPESTAPRKFNSPVRFKSAQRQSAEEQWICGFLLDPMSARPTFSADIHKTLNIFNP